jgi:DNA-binding SARP family transcriptional activator/tetratricopeptide (TPR) repeat protein
MEFRLLGQVEVSARGQSLEIGPPQQCLLLAALAADAGRLVTVESLIDRLWDDAPHGARRTLHVLISRLRRVLSGAMAARLEQAVVVRRYGGYELQVDPSQVDVHQFLRLASACCPGSSVRVEKLREALTWWRGEPLAGLRGEWAARVRAAWRQEYLEVVVAWADAELQAGNPAAAVGQLTALATEYPLAESLSAALMRMLSAVGRPADALAHYGQIRQRLADELGVCPGQGIQAVYQAVLRGGADPAGERTLIGRAAAEPDPTDTELDAVLRSSHQETLRGNRRSQVAPRQLPTAPRLFTGRAAEMACLTAGLAEAQAQQPERATAISVISGIPGVGKTWLALHWAHKHVTRFPDGQLWINLRGFDPCEPPLNAETALRGFLAALGVPAAEVPADQQAQSGLYRSLVAGKRILIVLDNARDTSQVVPLLPGGTDCLVLITSRRRLAGLAAGHGARMLDLDVLTEREGRDLLARSLGAERLTAEPEAAAELVACCAGLPLAISIAAAQAATHPGFPLATLAADLADDATRLDGLDTGEASASVRSVLSCSYRALGTSAASLFGLLGLAPGPDISLAAATSLGGMTVQQARAALLDLENAYLVQQHMPGRYRMHDLIALYALEQARTDQPAGARTDALLRVVDHYLHTAVAGEQMLSPQRYPLSLNEPVAGCVRHPLRDAADALAWFRIEYPCLLAAQRLAAAQCWHARVWQLAWATNTFHKFQANLHEWAATWQAGVAAADHLGQPAIQALARRCVGLACAYTGRHDEALNYLSEAMCLAERAGDTTARAHIEATLSRAWERQGNFLMAHTHAARAVSLFRTLRLPAWEADELSVVGWCQAHLGRLTEARVACDAALALQLQHHDRHGEANTRDTLGYVAAQVGDHAQALNHYSHALGLWRDLGHSHGEADSLAGLAAAYAASGAHGRASTAFRQAIELFRAQHRAAEADDLQRQLDFVTYSEGTAPGGTAAGPLTIQDMRAARGPLGRPSVTTA